MNRINKDQRGFAELVIIIVAVGVLIAAGLFTYNRIQSSRIESTTSSDVAQRTAKKQLVKDVSFSTTVDSSGAAVSPQNVFSATDSNIGVVIPLTGVKTGSRVSYTRYLNGKFVDNGGVSIAKDNANYVRFIFTTKANQTHPLGDYVVKAYVNGAYQTSGSYTVQ